MTADQFEIRLIESQLIKITHYSISSFCKCPVHLPEVIYFDFNTTTIHIVRHSNIFKIVKECPYCNLQFYYNFTSYTTINVGNIDRCILEL